MPTFLYSAKGQGPDDIPYQTPGAKVIGLIRPMALGTNSRSQALPFVESCAIR